jgi:hypothetical protein
MWKDRLHHTSVGPISKRLAKNTSATAQTTDSWLNETYYKKLHYYERSFLSVETFISVRLSSSNGRFHSERTFHCKNKMLLGQNIAISFSEGGWRYVMVGRFKLTHSSFLHIPATTTHRPIIRKRYCKVFFMRYFVLASRPESVSTIVTSKKSILPILKMILTPKTISFARPSTFNSIESHTRSFFYVMTNELKSPYNINSECFEFS